jgi:hypothetical protein
MGADNKGPLKRTANHLRLSFSRIEIRFASAAYRKWAAIHRIAASKSRSALISIESLSLPAQFSIRAKKPKIRRKGCPLQNGLNAEVSYFMLTDLKFHALSPIEEHSQRFLWNLEFCWFLAYRCRCHSPAKIPAQISKGCGFYRGAKLRENCLSHSLKTPISSVLMELYFLYSKGKWST